MSAQVITLAEFASTAPVATTAVEQKKPAPAGPRYTTITGSKYESGRDIADIARLVRADIKAATAAGILPQGTKCSVRIERYSMGRALHIDVSTCPILVLNPTHVRWRRDNPDASLLDAPENVGDRYSPEGRHILATLEEVVGTYNRRESSDQADDYSNVSFYSHVDFGSELRDEQRTAILALQPEVSLRNTWKPALVTPDAMTANKG